MLCSWPYNPNIVNVFSRAGEIEAWGREIERIIAVCKTEGYPVPEFQFDGGGLWTIFHFDEKCQKGTKTTQKATQKTTQKEITELTETQITIVEYLKEHPQAIRKELAEQIPHITEDGIKYHLARLQELGILRRIGGRKLGHWAFIEKA